MPNNTFITSRPTPFSWADDEEDDFDFDTWKSAQDTAAPSIASLPPLQLSTTTNDDEIQSFSVTMPQKALSSITEECEDDESAIPRPSTPQFQHASLEKHGATDDTDSNEVAQPAQNYGLDWTAGKPTVAWFRIEGREPRPAYIDFSTYRNGEICYQKRVNYASNWIVSKAENGLDCRFTAIWRNSPLHQVMSADAPDCFEETDTSSPQSTFGSDHSAMIEAEEHLDVISGSQTPRSEMDLATLGMDDFDVRGPNQELGPSGGTVEETDKPEMDIDDILDISPWSELPGEDDNGSESAAPTGVIESDTPEATKDTSLSLEVNGDGHNINPDEGYATGPSRSTTPEDTGKPQHCLSSDPTTVFPVTKKAQDTSKIATYITEAAANGWSYINNNPWKTASFLVATGILVGGAIRLARGR